MPTACSVTPPPPHKGRPPCPEPAPFHENMAGAEGQRQLSWGCSRGSGHEVARGPPFPLLVSAHTQAAARPLETALLTQRRKAKAGSGPGQWSQVSSSSSHTKG